MMTSTATSPRHTVIKRGTLLVECIERQRVDELVRGISERRFALDAFIFAEQRYSLRELGNTLTAIAGQTTPLHEMCRSAHWQLVRYTILKLAPLDQAYFTRVTEPHTGMTPLHALALRTVTAAADAAGVAARADEDAWYDTVFLQFGAAALARTCQHGFNVLHYLALRDRGQTFERTRERFPELAHTVNKYGQRPSDLRVAQREHDLTAVRHENSALRTQLETAKRTEAQLCAERAERLTQRVGAGENELAELRARATKLEQERDAVQARLHRVETERNALRFRSTALESERTGAVHAADAARANHERAVAELRERQRAQEALQAELVNAGSVLLTRDAEIDLLEREQRELESQLQCRLAAERERSAAELAEAAQALADAEQHELATLARERESAALRIAAIADENERRLADAEARALSERADAERALRAEQARAALREREAREAERLVALQRTEMAQARAAASASLAALVAERERALEAQRELQRQFDERGESLRALSAIAQRTRDELAAVTERLEKATAAELEARRENESLREEHERLRALHGQQTRASTANEAALARQREELRAQLGDTKRLLDAAQAERSATEADAERMTRRSRRCVSSSRSARVALRAPNSSRRTTRVRQPRRAKRPIRPRRTCATRRVYSNRSASAPIALESMVDAGDDSLEDANTPRATLTSPKSARRGLAAAVAAAAAAGAGGDGGGDELPLSATASPRTSGHSGADGSPVLGGAASALRRTTTLRRGVSATGKSASSRALAEAERERERREIESAAARQNAATIVTFSRASRCS